MSLNRYLASARRHAARLGYILSSLTARLPGGGRLLQAASAALATGALLLAVFMLYWSIEPAPLDLSAKLAQTSGGRPQAVTGYLTTATLREMAATLLEKPGGYISNDRFPPGAWLDNIANWEFGVLVQVRDMARVLRNDISRSQSQSLEDPDLVIAEPQFNFNSDSWLFPATESEYRAGVEALSRYLDRLTDATSPDAQFFARADNLAAWLGGVDKRLGSLSQRLSASVGQVRINTDLAGDANATHSTARPQELIIRTPWSAIDDVFYEARGTTWALIQLMKAIEVDFRPVLEKKNALVSLRQIIRELEATQETVWSPLILNGRGFGFLANHSLVMASYISRANAGIIDLRDLLARG